MNKSKYNDNNYKIISSRFKNINREYINNGLTIKDLQKCYLTTASSRNTKVLVFSLIILSICFLWELNTFKWILNYVLGIRCLVRNNFFIWEATRPISNCEFCANVTSPIVLHNATEAKFAKFAYSSKPIVIKGAFLHCPAMHLFDLKYFIKLYESIDDSYRSVDEECQFLHFKSDFISIRDVFEMSEARQKNLPGQKSWYVGWGNCHPQILEEMRKNYPKPHFLPEDCEIPSKEYVFMGYDDGATMHLDFINRLMWQAQLKGSKLWKLLPPPECENVCSSVSFVANPGDAVLVDTRVWYHGTTILSGDFSLSIQSEYG